MKSIYNAPNREMTAQELEHFAQKWNQKYPYAIQSEINNWDELTVFFDFPDTFQSKLEKLYIPLI